MAEAHVGTRAQASGIVIDGPESNAPVRLWSDDRFLSRRLEALSQTATISGQRPVRVIDSVATSLVPKIAQLPVVVGRNLVEAFIPAPAREPDHDLVLRRLWLRGLTFIGVFSGIVALWSVTVTISSAVIASGQFVTDSSIKKVQHRTGGIVGKLFVREGDQVKEGDLLVRLDETVTRSNLQIVVRQLDELAARRARLVAERDGSTTMEESPDLQQRATDPEVTRMISAEKRLFEARRAARASERGQLSKRIGQLRDEIAGLQAQKDANAREAKIIIDELNGLRELFAKKLVPLSRLSALERQAVNLDGQRGNLSAQIAQVEGKIAETELKLIKIDDDLRADSQKELSDLQAKVAVLSERRVAAEDELKRVDLRAPASGVVYQLSAHTIGGVIVPAEPVMLIVPTDDDLFLEAKVLPQDRDQLRVGQTTSVRIFASNQRNVPTLTGTLNRISADVSKDAAGPFYTVRISVPKTELDRLDRLTIVNGMQAEAFIEVGSRSPLSYLLKPFTDQVFRAFRER